MASQDPLYREFLSQMRLAIEEQTQAIAVGVHADMYHLGRSQGKLDGLIESLRILDSLQVDDE